MPRHSKSDIHRWPTFWRVDPDLVSRIKYAIVFSESEALFITKEDEVYGAGANENGCLGVYDTSVDLGEPFRLESLSGKKIVSIAAGSEPHVLAVSEDGDLYVWGGNSYGQLGTDTSCRLYTPTLSESMQGHRVKEVVCGYEHSLILTTTGKVFGCGSNDNGQIGPDEEYVGDCMLLVTGLPEGRTVTSIMCGSYTSFALTEGGQLFGWGYNGSGELGIETFDCKSSPQRIGAHQDLVFKSVRCGHGHVVALTHGGRVYSWGHNYYGQVGVGHATNVPTPTALDMDDRIFIEVGAHYKLHMSTAVTYDGKVYAWGQLKDKSEIKPKLTSFSSVNDVFATLAIEAVTCKPLTPLDEDNSEFSIQHCLRTHLDNSELSDVMFVFGKQKLHGHVSYLRMRSRYFCAMLSSNWGEKNEREISITGYSYNVYRAYLQYLYTDELQIDAEGAMELLQLADEYCEKGLKQRCEMVVMGEMNIENVFSLYATSKKLSAKELENFCFNFAIAHLNAATQTDAYKQLDDNIAKEFFQIAGSRNAFRN